MPNLLRAVTPKLSEEDRKVVDNTNKLLAFLLGNLQVRCGAVGSVNMSSACRKRAAR